MSVVVCSLVISACSPCSGLRLRSQSTADTVLIEHRRFSRKKAAVDLSLGLYPDPLWGEWAIVCPRPSQVSPDDDAWKENTTSLSF